MCDLNEKNKNKLIQEAKDLYKKGYSARSISAQLSLNRRTVAKYINYQSGYIHASKGIKKLSNLDPYKNIIIEMIDQRKKWNQIYELISANGYKGSESNLRSLLSRIKKGPLKKSDNIPTIERKHLISLLYRDDIKNIDMKIKNDVVSAVEILSIESLNLVNFMDIQVNSDYGKIVNVSQKYTQDAEIIGFVMEKSYNHANGIGKDTSGILFSIDEVGVAINQSTTDIQEISEISINMLKMVEVIQTKVLETSANAQELKEHVSKFVI